MRRHWPIAVVLLVQLSILAFVPAARIAARMSGTRVSLRTAPVDPYDPLSGYYMVLTYEVERRASEAAPVVVRRRDRFWLTVRRGEDGWTFDGLSRERPDVGGDRVALPARWNGRRMELVGAGRLFIPEAQRERAEELNRSGRGTVDLAVGADGTIAVLRLHLGGETFGE
jgi:hypothetical protein